jgi:hypothetical protein
LSDLRDQILNAKDDREEQLHISEWNADVLVRTMTARDRAKWGDSGSENAGVNLVILCTYDPKTRERIFQTTDRDALLQKASGPLDRICEVALRLNGLDSESRKAVERSLAPAPNGASISTSSLPASVVAP